MSPVNGNQRRSFSDDDDASTTVSSSKKETNQVNDVDPEEDAENDGEEGEDYVSDTDYLVQWTGPRKNMPVVLFRADAILEKESSAKCVGEKYKLAFKIVRTECKIVRSVLVSHGFHEVHPNSLDFNVMWTGSHIKPYVLRSFSEFQKVNHFPRSYELTRKDRLCKNVQRMQHLKGFRNFDFIPLTFITPIEFGDFQSTFVKERGTWIVKPVASSRGRGIFLINHPSQVPMDETLIVSRYINNPLLIDDFKFDIRLYVLVTSYDPLIVYLYEEGLARFASQKFDKSNKSVKNQFMHLTNYSINKRNPDFVQNADPELEDYGNKWSMSAMLRYLKSIGCDTAALMMRIEELVVKTFLAGEMAIASAANMFQPFRGNCFELYGFDVLVDENMKPWLMEVNLSPSLACDAPIDLKIKANMISDLFSIVGVTAQDPVSRRNGKRSDFQSRNGVRQQRRGGNVNPLLRTGVKGSGAKQGFKTSTSQGSDNSNPLTNEESKILRLAKEEYNRRGRWIRIFPSETSWENYGHLMEHRTTHNLMLFTKLYPNSRVKAGPSRPSSGYPSSSSNRPKTAVSSNSSKQINESNESNQFSCEIINRVLQYERRLMTLAESRAVSASSVNNRPTNSQLSVANSFSNTTSLDNAPSNVQTLAHGVRTHSASNEKARSSKSRSSQSVESSNRHQGRSLSDGSVRNNAGKKTQSSTKDATQESNSKNSKSTVNSEMANNKTRQSRSRTTVKKSSHVVAGVSDDDDSKSGTSYPLTGSRSRSRSTDDSRSRSSSSASSFNSDHSSAAASTDFTTQKAKEQVRSLLEQGHIFTVTQARLAFAAYLVRVHRRLLRESQHLETSPSHGTAKGVDAMESELKKEAEKHNAASEAQMNNDWDPVSEDLVLRFLKRAAQNLSQVFRVVVPSKKLSIQDRRRILAKQLSDFVSIYAKDTQTISIQEKNLKADKTPIADAVFEQFLDISNENDLEEILTLFTKINRSASVFLGGIQQLSHNSSSNAPANAGTLVDNSEKTTPRASGESQSMNSNTTMGQSIRNPVKRVADEANSGRGPRGDENENSNKGAIVGSVVGGYSNAPLSDKINQHYPGRRPPSGSERDKITNTAKVNGAHDWRQRDKSVDRRDRSVEREIHLKESSDGELKRRQPLQAKIAFDLQSQENSTSYSHSHPSLFPPNERSRSDNMHGRLSNLSSSGAPFQPSPSPPSGLDQNSSSSTMAASFEPNSPAFSSSDNVDRGQGSSLRSPPPCYDEHHSMSSRSTEPNTSSTSHHSHSAAVNVDKSVTSPDKSSSSRCYSATGMNSFSKFNSSSSSSRVQSAKGSTYDKNSGGPGSTPLNRGKKPRPYSAQLDAVARIYSENLTKTFLPINVSSKHQVYNNNSNSSSGAHNHASQPTLYNKSEDTINQALQRLAKRQATRQYSASNASSALVFQKSEDVAFDSTPRDSTCVRPRLPSSKRNDGAADWMRDNDESMKHASAYSLVTGVAPSNSYQATPGSTQYEVVQSGFGSSSGGGGRVSTGSHRPSSGRGHSIGNFNDADVPQTSSVVNNPYAPSSSGGKRTTVNAKVVSYNTVATDKRTNSESFNNHGASHEAVSEPTATNLQHGSNLSGLEDSPYYSRQTRASSASRRPKGALSVNQNFNIR